MKKGKLIAAQAFKLIESIINKLLNGNIIKHLCSTAGVSRSSYYNYVSSKNIRSSRENKDRLLRDNILKAFNYRGYKKESRSIKMTLILCIVESLYKE